MSKRTDSKPAAKEQEVSQINTLIDAVLHRDAKSAIAKKGKTFRQVIEKALKQEVAK